MRDFEIPAGTGSPAARPRNMSDGRASSRDADLPVAPRPLREAATVMLVRDGTGSGTHHGTAGTGSGTHSGSDGVGGVEVFVFRRVRGMAFAAGMLVFPGGAVDPADDDPRLTWSSGPPDQVPARVAVAAVRETFEECGVLLGRGESVLPADALDRLRAELIAGRTPLADVLTAAGLTLDAGLLHPWAHWVTPQFEARRYDARFFVARVPPGQQPRDLGGEGEQARWIRARVAVAQAADGELAVMPPTLVCLEELAAARSVEELFAAPRRLRPVSPWLVTSPGPDGAPVRRLRVHLDGVGGGEPEGVG